MTDDNVENSSQLSASIMSDDNVNVDSIFGTSSIGSLLNSGETSFLVEMARNIAKAHMDENLENKNPPISLGALLLALLDNASDEDTLHTNCSPLHYTASVICGAKRDDRLNFVADVWLKHMLLPIKAARAVITTYPTEDQTPHLDSTAITIQPTRRRAAFRQELLKRENYRCAVNRHSIDPDSEALAKPQPGERAMTKLQACHIVPFSLNNFAETGHEFKDAAITWTLLKSWTGFKIQQLVGEGINDPSNGILMEPGLHDSFGAFRMHFEPADSEDTYRVCSVRYGELYPQVRFEPREGIAVPNPRLLAIHAAFARVLYASGAGEYFNQIWRDSESIGGLSQDGSTDIGFLMYSLKILAVR